MFYNIFEMSLIADCSKNNLKKESKKFGRKEKSSTFASANGKTPGRNKTQEIIHRIRKTK